MAEFVKKDDGTNVKLIRKVPVKTLSMGDPDGIMAYIKSFTTSYEALSAGHLVELRLFVTDEDMARGSGLKRHIYPGGKICITLVKDGVFMPVGGPGPDTIEAVAKRDLHEGEPVSADDLEELDSEPAGEEEHDEDYEEDTEGPPPVIPPAAESGPTEKEYQENDKHKAESSETALAMAMASAAEEERLRTLTKMLEEAGG